jgi:MoxR-like ATPase
LGEVLVWSINTRSTLQEGLYYYDAIARLQDAQLSQPRAGNGEEDEVREDKNIGQYIRLGSLGTAMYPQDKPRVLLIDEIDKSDIDLPNDLLNLLEDGRFEIQELTRLTRQNQVNQTPIEIETQDGNWQPGLGGKIACKQFPIVIMTSNGERDFPLPFKRRCLPLFMTEPNKQDLAAIVKAHFDLDPKKPLSSELEEYIDRFLKARAKGELATDQLLNIVFMMRGKNPPTGDEKESLIRRLQTFLNEDSPDPNDS